MATLRELAERRGLLIGAACSPTTIAAEPVYAATLAREFNCLVAENCMKPQYVQPAAGRFDFTEPDRLVAFARQHGQQVRGHTLVWHNQMPAWLREGTLAKPAALAALRDHVHGVLAHYRGALCCWDVVNEALADDGGWRVKSPWYAMAGSDYVEAAFRAAHEADPQTVLLYNDYGMELPGPKADACYRLLRDFVSRGVPVHGVGFQYHLGVENRLDHDACVANLRRFAELGLQVQFTEMDMGIKRPITDALRQEQAVEYANRVRIALDAGCVTALVFWGFTDRHSWIPGFTKGEYDEPLLFDRDYRPKPAYEAICRVLES